MTITGIVLGNLFANASGLCDIAADTLKSLGAENVYISDKNSLKEFIAEKLNDTEEAVFAVLSASAFAEKDIFAPSDFCVQKNIRLVTEDNTLVGAVMTDASEICDIKETRTVNAEIITPQNFADKIKVKRSEINSRFADNNVYIDEGAKISPLAVIGSGSYIGAGVTVCGNSVIGENCTLIGSTRIKDTVIGCNTAVESCVITDAKVGNNVTMGPFAYVRPHSVIGDNVKVGDFVEVKNATIGDGTKISHLTYVGDSDVGKGVNFGCGTVTVNYDGVKKHRTTIGDNAFIGCNTNLVSPVKVGDNAYIAAGSTVTDNIPDKSFAIARSRQTTKENYVAEKMSFMIKEK